VAKELDVRKHKEAAVAQVVLARDGVDAPLRALLEGMRMCMFARLHAPVYVVDDGIASMELNVERMMPVYVVDDGVASMELIVERMMPVIVVDDGVASMELIVERTMPMCHRGHAWNVCVYARVCVCMRKRVCVCVHV